MTARVVRWIPAAPVHGCPTRTPELPFAAPPVAVTSVKTSPMPTIGNPRRSPPRTPITTLSLDQIRVDCRRHDGRASIGPAAAGLCLLEDQPLAAAERQHVLDERARRAERQLVAGRRRLIELDPS